MDIYIYVGDTLILGKYEKPQVLLPLSEEVIFEDNEDLGVVLPNGKRRLNIYVYDGWEENGFSSQVQTEIQLYFNLCHDGEGEVYLVNNGIISIITESFQ